MTCFQSMPRTFDFLLIESIYHWLDVLLVGTEHAYIGSECTHLNPFPDNDPLREVIHVSLCG